MHVPLKGLASFHSVNYEQLRPEGLDLPALVRAGHTEQRGTYPLTARSPCLVVRLKRWAPGDRCNLSPRESQVVCGSTWGPQPCSVMAGVPFLRWICETAETQRKFLRWKMRPESMFTARNKKIRKRKKESFTWAFLVPSPLSFSVDPVCVMRLHSHFPRVRAISQTLVFSPWVSLVCIYNQEYKAEREHEQVPEVWRENVLTSKCGKDLFWNLRDE